MYWACHPQFYTYFNLCKIVPRLSTPLYRSPSPSILWASRTTHQRSQTWKTLEDWAASVTACTAGLDAKQRSRAHHAYQMIGGPCYPPCWPIKTNEITRKLEVFNFYFKKVQLLFMSAQLRGHNEQSWLLLCLHQFCLLAFYLCLN